MQKYKTDIYTMIKRYLIKSLDRLYVVFLCNNVIINFSTLIAVFKRMAY